MRTYVVFGTEREPALKLLTPSQDRLFYTRTMVVEDSRKAVAVTFGAGFEWAVPAWNHESLRPLAERYEGPHEMRLRAICAAIILGMALEDLDRRRPRAPTKSAEDDGHRVPLVPPTPTRPPRPAAVQP